MRFYGLPASEEHSADMLQLRLSRLSRIERRPGPGLADNIPCYHLAITNGALHDISSLRLPTSLLHHTIPPQQLQPVFDQAAMRQAAMQRVCADIKAAQAGNGRQTRKLSE